MTYSDWIITEGEREALRNAYRRLYSERRMSGDEMRDMAHVLELVYVNAVKLEEDDGK